MPCPIGTYASSNGTQSLENCEPCPARFACNDTALTSPEQLCFPGYYCKSGVAVPNPDSGATGCLIEGGSPFPSIGDICPMGSYCPEGSDAPLV